jgi:hypothetical protein
MQIKRREETQAQESPYIGFDIVSYYADRISVTATTVVTNYIQPFYQIFSAGHKVSFHDYFINHVNPRLGRP